jgi:hypothetical protein
LLKISTPAQTTVAGGVLDVEGSIANSGATVEHGATLGGGGTVGGVIEQTGATVAPGLTTSFATLIVLGNVTFGAGSIFYVKANAAGQNDKLTAGGTASLQGGTVQVAAERFTLLTANGGICPACDFDKSRVLVPNAKREVIIMALRSALVKG